MKMLLVVLMFGLCFLNMRVVNASSSSSIEFSESEYENLKNQFIQINSQDGIQKDEAELIGKYYLLHVLAVSAEGKKRDPNLKIDQVTSYSELKDKGHYWQVDVEGEFEYANSKLPIQKIYISKIYSHAWSTFSSGMGGGAIKYKDVTYSFNTAPPDAIYDYVIVDCGRKEKTSRNLCRQMSKEIADGLSKNLSSSIKPIESRHIDVQLVTYSDCNRHNFENNECYNWQSKIPLVYKQVGK